MGPPSPSDIEAALSYSYLHAVSHMAGAVCREATRLEDNNGIDATLVSWGPFPSDVKFTEMDLKIQLKATTKPLKPFGKDHFSYFFEGVSQYDDLRKDTVASPRILVVLFLPKKRDRWLGHGTKGLVLRNCAYWVSLRGANSTTNASGQTVYIPKLQVFSPANLMEIMTKLAYGKKLVYKEPS